MAKRTIVVRECPRHGVLVVDIKREVGLRTAGKMLLSRGEMKTLAAQLIAVLAESEQMPSAIAKATKKR